MITSGSTLLANSAAYTATQQFILKLAQDSKSLQVFLNMTNAGTGSVSVLIEGQIPGTAAYYTIIQSANITTNSFVRLVVGLGVTPASNLAVNDVLPPTVRVTVTANNGNPATYSLSAW
jgi:hypothetical protein